MTAIEAVMPSHSIRDEIRERCLARYADLGIRPKVSRQNSYHSRARSRMNAARALSLAEGDGPVLFVEDDTIPGAMLPAWIETLASTFGEREIVFLFSLARQIPKAERSIVARREERGLPAVESPRVVEAANVDTFTGSQAVLFSRGMVEAILADPAMTTEAASGRPFDWTLRGIAVEAGARVRATIPSVVEHESPASVVRRRRERPLLAWRFDPEAAPPEAHTLE